VAIRTTASVLSTTRPSRVESPSDERESVGPGVLVPYPARIRRAVALKPTPFTRQGKSLHGGPRRSAREARRVSGRSSTALPSMTVSKRPRAAALFVDRWSPRADPHVDEGAWPRAIREAVRLSLTCRSRCDPMAAGRSPSDASFSSFPWDHEGPWVSATRERVLPCARLPVPIRPHGRRPPGRGVDPCACLPVAMRPDGCPRSRDGYILRATWPYPSAHMDVRLARRGASFW
jgi:hypothetical protein